MTDNLFAQGIITQDLVSVSFEPTSSPEIVNGELTFGGTDSSKFSGSINFVCVPSIFSPLNWTLLSPEFLRGAAYVDPYTLI